MLGQVERLCGVLLHWDELWVDIVHHLLVVEALLVVWRVDSRGHVSRVDPLHAWGLGFAKVVD